MSNHSKVLFISRRINTADFYWPEIEALGFTIYNESLIEFEGISFDLPLSFDWIYFSSKNGVNFFDARLSLKEKQVVLSKNISAIGVSTAQVVEEIIGRVDHVFDGDPLTASSFFSHLDESESILFPRAIHSNRTTQKNITSDANCIDLPVYSNHMKPFEFSQSVDVAILTSPFNAEAFFSNYDRKSNPICFVPGETTLSKVSELNISNVILLDSNEEKGWSEEILHYLRTSTR